MRRLERSAFARVPSRHDNRRLTGFLDVARRLQVCRLNPAFFCNDSPHEEPMLRREGPNFSSWYIHLLQEDGDSFECPDCAPEDHRRFPEAQARKVGPRQGPLGRLRYGQEEYELRLEDFPTANASSWSFTDCCTSEQIRISPVCRRARQFLAASEIQPWLLAAEDAIGEGLPQVVIVFHHAEVIDYLGGDRGILFERGVTGVTKTRPLRDVGIPDAMKLSEVLTRGRER